MKKLVSLVLIAMITLAGCSNESAPVETETQPIETQPTETETTEANTQEEGFILEYTESMQELGYTEALVLEEEPTRIVSLSTGSIAALFDMEASLVGVPNTSIIEIPESYTGEKLLSMMSEDFNIESVIELQPDLVILGYSSAETFGAILEEVNIPVYYVASGHTVSYEATKQESLVFADAFGTDETKAQLEQAYADLESRLEEVHSLTEGKTVMVLQSAPPSHYIQTEGGTLGSMLAMMGFENVYSNEMASMVQIDYEQALSYQPDYVFAVGSMPEEAFKVAMEEDFANNETYWNAIDAIKEGRVEYLPVTYISNTGVDAIEHINALIDRVEVMLQD